jgi:proto-oncogene tyrosine-protein kinase ROS
MLLLVGKGAWQSWWYEVQVKDVGRGTMKTYNATSTSLTLAPLLPDTRYSVRACAYSTAGTGPWSSEYMGQYV